MPPHVTSRRIPKLKRIMTHDLHGYSVPEGLFVAMHALANRPEFCEKVNFVVGRGIHSKEALPLLKIALQDEMAKQGYTCRVMSKNPGIVEVFPYRISSARGEKKPQIVFEPHASL
jgi:hypothetical protein